MTAIPNDVGRTILTIDGPAGSGKSTTARAVAARLGWTYLDSGALYRALTLALLRSNFPRGSWNGLSSDDLQTLEIEIQTVTAGLSITLEGSLIDDRELRTDEVTSAVSEVSAIKSVRGWLLESQRRAGEKGELVADGRDMGTVVFPHAWTKVFLKADSSERARRRLREKGRHAPDAEALEAERERITKRDIDDSSRVESPLRVPDQAVIVDTTDLKFEEQVERILTLVERVTEFGE